MFLIKVVLIKKRCSTKAASNFLTFHYTYSILKAVKTQGSIKTLNFAFNFSWSLKACSYALNISLNIAVHLEKMFSEVQ